MIEKTAHVHWKGAGKQGQGHISIQTEALQRCPYGFASRFEDDRQRPVRRLYRGASGQVLHDPRRCLHWRTPPP